MKKQFLLLFLIAFCTALWGQSNPKNLEFKNGNWYNGETFVSGTWYVSNGILSKKAPANIDSTIDLLGRYVVPPMADVHSSSLGNVGSIEQQLKMYYNDGVFYIQTLANTAEARAAVDKVSGKPNTPDVAFANGPITCTLGYPFVKYEGPAAGIKNPQQWGSRYDEIKNSRKLLGDGYWFIDNKDALNANWSKITAQKPNVISIYLLDAAANGGKEGKGLSPDVAKMIIKKAHKADLRVYAHVETAEDVRLALKLGADGLANYPGNNWDGSGKTDRFELDDADLKKLAKKKIPVVTLFNHAQQLGAKTVVQDWHRKTFNRLLEKGVNVVTGSDDAIRTIRAEMNYWFGLGITYSPRLLNLLVEKSAQAVFPDRKIGRIAEGYEASFLVLDANPTENIMKVRVIGFKVKNGVIVK
ncbi:MAG: amidohydrolase family protein [Saprospiraceae bacterium]|nr:amidohydrolase family protein [Saprospiraceae bacterium]